MNLTTYPTVEQFLSKAQPFLEANEALNNLVLGITFRLRDQPERFEEPPYLATVEDESGIVMAVMLTPPFNIALAGEPQNAPAVCDLVAQDLLAQGQMLPGVLGPSVLSQTFAETWSRLSSQPYRDGMRQRVFALHEVVYFGSAAGWLRPAIEADLSLVMAWLTGFLVDALAGEGQSQVGKMAQRHITDGTLYLWENNGQPVSMAAKTRQTRHGRTVSLVYTPPEYRNRGYATACVAHLSQLLLDSGWQFCTLFTDLANPTSNAIYQKIGYRALGDFNEYKFGDKGV